MDWFLYDNGLRHEKVRVAGSRKYLKYRLFLASQYQNMSSRVFTSMKTVAVTFSQNNVSIL